MTDHHSLFALEYGEHYEYRVAYTSDGSIEEMLDPTCKAEAEEWIDTVNLGHVEGTKPGEAFLQQRRVRTIKYPWRTP